MSLEIFSKLYYACLSLQDFPERFAFPICSVKKRQYAGLTLRPLRRLFEMAG